MKRLALPALMLVAMTSGAFAQMSNTPAVAPRDTNNPAAPVPGANSFTEAQAKERIEKAGYSGVSGLMKDDKGIWQAKASKGGAPMNVMVDFQGNVVSK